MLSTASEIPNPFPQSEHAQITSRNLSYLLFEKLYSQLNNCIFLLTTAICAVCPCFNVLTFHVQSSIELPCAINHSFIHSTQDRTVTISGSFFFADILARRVADNSRVNNEMWCIMRDAAQQIRNTQTDIRLWVTEPRKQLRNDSCGNNIWLCLCTNHKQQSAYYRVDKSTTITYQDYFKEKLNDTLRYKQDKRNLHIKQLHLQPFIMFHLTTRPLNCYQRQDKTDISMQIPHTILTFPWCCSTAGKTFFKYVTQLPCMFHQHPKQSQSRCDFSIHITCGLNADVAHIITIFISVIIQ